LSDCSISDVSDKENGRNTDIVEHSRRKILTTLPIVIFVPTIAHATTGSLKTSQYAGKVSSSSSSSKIKPQVAFEGLIKAREELQNAQNKYLSKRDYNGLRKYLEGAENINNFERNALAILTSKKLDDEDKKAIGTIRRYGSGADVIIMYGGLIAEIDEGNEEPDAATVQKYMTRTMDSLDEVIAICKNSGGFV
jgi:hypothetical protein